mgnify:CR=1 FL=1
MPERFDGKEVFSKPKIKEKGGGLYTVSNLNLGSGEFKRLTIRIKKKKAEDSVTFIFPEDVEKRKPKGKYEDE